MAVKIVAGSFYKVIKIEECNNGMSNMSISIGDIYQADKKGQKNTYRVIKANNKNLTRMRYNDGAYISIKSTQAKQMLELIDVKDVEGLMVNDIPLYAIPGAV